MFCGCHLIDLHRNVMNNLLPEASPHNLQPKFVFMLPYSQRGKESKLNTLHSPFLQEAMPLEGKGASSGQSPAARQSSLSSNAFTFTSMIHSIAACLVPAPELVTEKLRWEDEE